MIRQSVYAPTAPETKHAHICTCVANSGSLAESPHRIDSKALAPHHPVPMGHNPKRQLAITRSVLSRRISTNGPRPVTSAFPPGIGSRRTPRRSPVQTSSSRDGDFPYPSIASSDCVGAQEVRAQLASTSTNAMRAGAPERLAQAWDVPRCTSTSPALMTVSLLSMTRIRQMLCLDDFGNAAETQPRPVSPFSLDRERSS